SVEPAGHWRRCSRSRPCGGRMTALAVWILAALTGLQGGGAQATSQPTLKGTVVDAKTNAPIKDARVTLVEASLDTRTGADGRFEFTKVAPKTYTLTVS